MSVFFTSYFAVTLVTASTWCIANNKPYLVLLLSVGISFSWMFNVRSVASVNSGWKNRLLYIAGALCGSATTLKLTGMI